MEISCDVSKSLLCNNIFHSLDILSSTPSFQIWSSGQFYTTTYLNISLKLLPKLGEFSRSLLFHFVQKPIYILWKIWVNQPHLHSRPTGGFVQQPYFCLLFNPWFFLLLVVLHVKRELAEIGYGLGKNLRTCWLGQELKLTMQIWNHAETGHALRVFDKMPKAPR